MFYLIANWKANKTPAEAKSWMERFTHLSSQDTFTRAIRSNSLRLVLCPPFTLFPVLSPYLTNLSHVYLGAQDVSRFTHGSYTGEVPASSFPKNVKYAIIGHSERRRHFQETDNEVREKARRLQERSIEAFVCLRDTRDAVPPEASYVVYEPESAVGKDYTEPLESILSVKRSLNIPDGKAFLYGGNVNKTNIGRYIESGEIAGFLVGRASLDPDEFMHLASYFPV